MSRQPYRRKDVQSTGVTDPGGAWGGTGSAIGTVSRGIVCRVDSVLFLDVSHCEIANVRSGKMKGRLCATGRKAKWGDGGMDD